jgi:ammonium transporter Rh
MLKGLRWLLPTAIFGTILCFLASAGVCHAQEVASSLVDVQKYDRSIQIMAMLLVGFGFLMVFLKRYGRSALVATFLLVSVAIPSYMVLSNSGFFGSPSGSEIDGFILAEFAAASLLICAGACMGRLKLYQYLVLGILFIPFYKLNEWIILENGLGIISAGKFVDTGGSIIIHAFGALFGLGLVLALTKKHEQTQAIEPTTRATGFLYSAAWYSGFSGPVSAPRWWRRSWFLLPKSMW